MRLRRKWPQARPLIDGVVDQAEKDELAKRIAWAEKETAEVLSWLDEWIDDIEGYLNFWTVPELAEIAPELAERVSDCLKHVAWVKQLREQFRKSDIYGALGVLSACLLGEAMPRLDRDIGRKVDDLRRSGTRKDRVKFRRAWLKQYLESLGLTKADLQGIRGGVRDEIYEAYKEQFPKTKKRVFNDDLKRY